MKRLVSILSVIFLISNWLFNFSAASSAQRIARRQTNDGSARTRNDFNMCYAKVNDILCTNGITQRFIEADLSCNTTTIRRAQEFANSCARDEDGQFCKSLSDLYSNRMSYIDGNCSEVLSQNSCPSNCSSLLEDFRNTLGCCINAYVNSTGSYFGTSRVNYRVWNLCSVPLPPAACENSPTINPPDNVQNCTNEELFTKYYTENLCLPEIRVPYVEAAQGTEFCNDIPSSWVNDLCMVNANGVPCGMLYNQYAANLASLNSACNTSEFTCTLDCMDGIIAAKNRYGCCLRSPWFNSSIETPVSALNPRVLQSCDIDLPEACEKFIGSEPISAMPGSVIKKISATPFLLLLV